MSRARTPLSALTALVAGLVALLVLAAGAPVARLTPGTGAGATVHWSDADPIGGATSTTVTSALYKFAAVVNGKPVRWNPCQTIYWQFRYTAAPASARTVVRAAVARVAQLTGTKWVEKGSTSALPASGWLPRSSDGIRPVLIGWTDAAHSDLLRNRPASVLGVTRTAYFGTTVAGISLAATKAAVIALDRTDKLPLTGRVSWKTTLLHELGHAMGLDHVGNTAELMYPVLGRSMTDFQAGDKAGLARLGRSAGCINLGF
ncbi:MAG TPA: matrixin family metalloprotease [Mycobacteriales bacterium]|nr:matrixin family metalloprotease [Mycobacteriales bacterium]